MDFYCLVGTAQSVVAVRAALFFRYFKVLSFRLRYDMPLCVVLDKC